MTSHQQNSGSGDRAAPRSNLPRADRLTAPPAAGRYYMVPVVTAAWHHFVEPWPVMGPLHTDKEFFNFERDHYHIDARFLTARQFSLVENAVPWREPLSALQNSPLHAYDGSELPKPVLTKRRCRAIEQPYQHGDKQPIMELRRHFAGHQCATGKGGWICPHRKFALGSTEAIDGIITCPLHGLQIDAATGLVVSPCEASALSSNHRSSSHPDTGEST